MENEIRQKKLDALISIELHKKRIDKLQPKNLLIKFLCIAVPVFYYSPSFLAKGTTFAIYIDAIGYILNSTLLVLGIFELVYQLQNKEIRHSIMERENREIEFAANQLLNKDLSKILESPV